MEQNEIYIEESEKTDEEIVWFVTLAMLLVPIDVLLILIAIIIFLVNGL
jgi:hypothetical protein